MKAKDSNNEQPERIQASQEAMEVLLQNGIQQITKALRIGTENLVGLSFILDADERIIACNDYVTEILTFPMDELRGKPMRRVLIDESFDAWEEIVLSLQENTDTDLATDELLLRTQEGFAVPCFCQLSRLGTSSNFLLVAIKTIMEDRQAEHRLRESIEAYEETQDLLNHPESNDHHNHNNNPNHNHNGYAQRVPDDRIAKATEYMLGNLVNPLSVTELAEHAGMRIPLFKKAFVKHHGLTVYDYFDYAMAEKAKKLLQKKDVSIATIAVALNYTTEAFSTMFQKVTHVTPEEYRKQLGF